MVIFNLANKLKFLCLILITLSLSIGDSSAYGKSIQDQAQVDINEDELVASFNSFFDMLKNADFDGLEKIYSEDYQLIRPSGETLSKEQVLADLRSGNLTVKSIRITDMKIKIRGQVGIISYFNQLSIIQNSQTITLNLQQTATFNKTEDSIELIHFQSTPKIR